MTTPTITTATPETHPTTELPTNPSSLYAHDEHFKAWIRDIEPVIITTLSKHHVALFYYAFKAGEKTGKDKAKQALLNQLKDTLGIQNS